MDIEEALKILDLPNTATKEKIKQAHHDLAIIWHPDKHNDNPRRQKKAEEKLKEINAAYEFLKNIPDNTKAQPSQPTQSLSHLKQVSIDKLKTENNFNSSQVTHKKKAMDGFRKFRKDWIEPILIAIILVTIIKTFFFQNFKIPSGSMEDTLLVGDYLFAVKFLYGTKIPFTDKIIWKIRDPEQGDIVVFKSVEEKKDLIKRIVAVEGQTLEIRDTKVFVDGVEFPLPKHAKITDPTVIPAGMGYRDNLGPIKIPKGMLFAMGDNRDNSYDSRFWGFLPQKNVKGKALFFYWSWNHDAPLYDVAHKVRWARIFNPIN